VIRVAGNFQVDNVFYTGEPYPRAVRLNPDIPLSGVSDLLENATENMKIVCVEFAENVLA